MKRAVITILAIVGTIISHAQVDDALFDRLQGFANNEFKFFNTDGIEISAIPMKGVFTPKSIAKQYKEYRIKDSDIKNTDSLLSTKNYYVSKKMEGQYQDIYFLEHNDRILGMIFRSAFEIDRQFERDFVKLFTTGKIPDDICQKLTETQHINFAGRPIVVKGCHWMSPNNLQCPYNGQMNWSSFKTMEAAQRELESHFQFINANKKGKVISDEQVAVIFEDQEVMARKLVFDLTGVISALAATTGGKTLTVYMVVAPVRNKFLECVISHWNNDNLDANGLPAIVSGLMTLK
ncbi:MAG: hypothetical protein WDO15_30395 [Bacteroidota bacterium]